MPILSKADRVALRGAIEAYDTASYALADRVLGERAPSIEDEGEPTEDWRTYERGKQFRRTEETLIDLMIALDLTDHMLLFNTRTFWLEQGERPFRRPHCGYHLIIATDVLIDLDERSDPSS